MLVICVKDGLTQGKVVYKAGDIFRLDDRQVKDLEGKSDAQIEVDQKKIYGKAIYKRATQEELFTALKMKKITKDVLDDEEKKYVCIQEATRHEREARSWRIASGEEVDDEDSSDTKKSKGKVKE
jgi:hypothetical protein